MRHTLLPGNCIPRPQERRVYRRPSPLGRNLLQHADHVHPRFVGNAVAFPATRTFRSVLAKNSHFETLWMPSVRSSHRNKALGSWRAWMRVAAARFEQELRPHYGDGDQLWGCGGSLAGRRRGTFRLPFFEYIEDYFAAHHAVESRPGRDQRRIDFLVAESWRFAVCIELGDRRLEPLLVLGFQLRRTTPRPVGGARPVLRPSISGMANSGLKWAPRHSSRARAPVQNRLGQRKHVSQAPS